MRKVKYPAAKLCFLAAFILTVLIFYFNNIPCISKAVTHIDCIGCGMTRAWLAVFRLDISAAFSYHPAFWTVPVLFTELFFDMGLFKNRKLDLTVVGISVTALILTYLIRVIIPFIF